MKRSYRFEGLSCAHCAARLEGRLAKLEGVEALSISFFAEKLILEAADDRFPEVLARVAAAARKAEPKVTFYFE